MIFDVTHHPHLIPSIALGITFGLSRACAPTAPCIVLHRVRIKNPMWTLGPTFPVV